jgi:hypothetical protein
MKAERVMTLSGLFNTFFFARRRSRWRKSYEIVLNTHEYWLNRSVEKWVNIIL